MATYRVLPSRDFTCPADHTFRTSVMYEYSGKQIWFEVVSNAGTWVEPAARPPKTVMPICPVCSEPCSYDNVVFNEQPSKGTGNVQVPDSEAAAVAVHPQTGEVVYCFDRPDRPLPAVWKEQGFVKQQFNHYKDLERFCRQTGQVNDIEGDWAHDGGFFEEDLARRKKIEAQRLEQYMDERENVMRAHPELRRRDNR